MAKPVQPRVEEHVDSRAIDPRVVVHEKRPEACDVRQLPGCLVRDDAGLRQGGQMSAYVAGRARPSPATQ